MSRFQNELALIQRDSRYYTKEELEKRNICIDTLLKYSMRYRRTSIVNEYRSVLDEKGKIWIGQTSCSSEFANKYRNIVLLNANELVCSIIKKYNCKVDAERVASATLEYILKDEGQIEKNFGDDENKVIKIINATMENFIGQEYSKDEYKIVDLHNNTIPDSEENVQKLGNKEEIGRKCLKLVIQGTKQGLELKQAIIEASKALEIKPTEALTIMKEMQAKRKKAKADSEIGE